MFSFHRPKVYRSSTGCCICKAKSSSSRFTDSKKYEEDFLECFKLATPRQGEICNACVLLVKRWKKLPKGSDRNWRHVVDARAGPGMKSFTKYKVKKAKAKIPSEEKVEKIRRKKHYEREYSPVLSDGDDLDMVDMEFFSEDGPSMGSSRTESPGVSDSDDGLCAKNRRCKRLPKKCIAGPKSCVTLDPDYWKKESTCCGTIIRGLAGELMIDPTSLKPCSARLATLSCVKLTDEAVYEMEVSSNIEIASNVEVMDMPNPTQVPVISEKAVSKLFSDSSSDSGYEELSNPAMSPTGTIVPHTGTTVPQTASNLLHTGTTAPHNGKIMSPSGKALPYTGTTVLHNGTIVSHTAASLTHSGNVLSHARTVLSYTGPAIPQSYAVKSNIEQVSIVEASYIAPNRIISGH